LERNMEKTPGGHMARLSLFVLAAALVLTCGCSRCYYSETHISMNGLNFDTSGSVEFTDDDRDVKSLSPGGFVRITRGSPLTTWRSYEVRSDMQGILSREYRVYGREQPLDAIAQRWVADGMLQLIRETGAGAETRVQRLVQKGGPTAVLLEVRAIQSDAPKRIYLRELLRNGSLNEQDAREAMQVGKRISSDGDKAGLLIDVADIYLRSRLREPWFAAAATISSDGDRRSVLQHAVSHDGTNPETLILASKSARELSSDGDKAAVLADIAQSYEPEIRIAYFRAVNSISSDGDRCRLLAQILKTEHSDSETVAEILQSAAAVSSDGDKRQVLEQAAQYDLPPGRVLSAFFSAVKTISSDGDRAAVLSAALKCTKPQADLLAHLADSAKQMSSDGDKAAVLSKLADAGVTDAAVRDSFFAAVNSISSDGDRAAVLTHVLRTPGVPAETAVAAIESATRMSSDGDKANVLVSAAEKYGTHTSVRAALRKALPSIHSDGDYRRVTDALLGS
jgi:hypothetical protein